MGYMRHNAIVVTTWSDERLEQFAMFATEQGARLLVQAPIAAGMNGYRSALVCPDGSKEGWDTSNNGDMVRAAIRKWLAEQRYDDGSSAFEWVEIAYGCDDSEAVIEHSEWSDGDAMGSGKE